MVSLYLVASCHTMVGEYMRQALVASHWRSVLYYLVGVLNHWQPSPMPKRL
ncbi:hypothetical protein AH006_000942 [Salmonella enterica subsp. enterica]|uniref:Uncharacterized protein n=1 Tax=Salmonella enterica subsp. salamae serovar 42:f,g,t:-- TaxID=41518 RepID=A0A737GTV6_SALER|nr:hypothetical protein [Salmonella enterica subsp. enterica serovar Anatum]EDT1753240.1 hypothetical protein [Salmonella enterica subsp. enterica]EDT5788676.1 hypothetical protein [Salmonella enterica subsp. enterica serovar Nchanga]EDT6715162.1 hypothetical protein [Salmonella enterica subsp. enterica serovar Poona]EDV3716981.1 hypothetical protein [Salmonella enterica subsp. enterica serovar Blockley]EDV7231228.1 hypothetical protein [Salmonella enterica subsp. enterica serovar Amager]EED7